MKTRVLSGIRATGRLHLGNYLGAVKGMLELQNDPKYETFYMVADLHALTTPFDPKELKKNRREVIKDYLAAGLDSKKSVIFEQSDSLHAELSFYLSSVMTVARMQHLPTYKEKIKQYPKHATMALLNYPVLMAADILAYKAHEVPVGDDQLPHLEVAREIAKKMNDQYGTDFPEPEQFKTKGSYVPSLMSLIAGEKKMSKSVEGSYIGLTDDLETIREKIAKVPTDSGMGSDIVSPGTDGALTIFTLVELFQPGKGIEYAKQRATTGVKYSEIKEELSQAIFKELEPIQKRRELLSDDYIDNVIKEGGEKARKVVEQTILEVREKMGLK